MKLAALLLLAPLAASAAGPTGHPLAPTPPMGWNVGIPRTTSPRRRSKPRDYMAARLKSHGWQYVVVTFSGPSLSRRPRLPPNADLVMDEYGRLTARTNRFPSAAGGKGFARWPITSTARVSNSASISCAASRAGPWRGPAGLRRQGARRAIADTKSLPWNTDMYGVDMSKPGAQDYYDSILQLYAAWA